MRETRNPLPKKKHLTSSTKCGKINMKGEGHSPNQKGYQNEEIHHAVHR